MGAEPRTRLPIDDARNAFETALRGGAPVVVQAPTGSGKSTRLPGWIADAREATVLVVEPRRIACRALATYVAEQRGTDLGDEVGYQVRFEGRHGERTRILFVTPGVALSMLAEGSHGRIAAGVERFACVMVDEFHERAWEVDLVVALVREAKARGATVDLVLCSATLDEEDLAARLSAAVVRSEGRTFPVTIEHEGEGGPSDRDLDVRVAQAVRTRLRASDGDVLVFLPGKGEIERCGRMLDADGDARVVPVHGGLPPAALARALGPASQRRVFLATNVAETSLTIPGVTSVVDSGLVRMRIHQAGRSVLALVPTSQASAGQRAGRAGRVAPGHCVRLWSSHYATATVTPPEVERIELDDMVLRAATGGLTAAGFDEAPWVTPPPGFAVARARARLAEGGELDADGEITDRGRARARLPVSPLSARLLAGAPGPIAGVVADLVALIETGRDLVLSSRGGAAESLDDGRHALFEGALDEVEVQLRALWHGREREHGLHAGAVSDCRRLARQLRGLVGAPTKPREASMPRDALLAYALRRLPHAAFVRRARADRPRASSRSDVSRGGSRGRGRDDRPAEPWGNGELEVFVRPQTIPGLSPDEQPDPPRAALILELAWLGSGRGARGVGRLLLRCTYGDLVEAGIGEVEVTGPALERPEGKKRGRARIVGEVEHRHAGVVLARGRQSLHGEALGRAMAELILARRLAKTLGEGLQDALHDRALLHQAASSGSESAAPTSPRDYLAARLQELGASSAADLQLLEPDDVRPDLDALADTLGLERREAAALRRDFPRTWSYQGTQYDCTVELAARRVTLEPTRSVGKGREPPQAVLPRFRGFAVWYVKASRRIQLR